MEQEFLKACKDGNIVKVKKIIKKEININYADNDGWNALMCASLYGYLKIVKFLIENGSYVDHVDNDGWNALMYAEGYLKVVNYLIKYNIKNNITMRNIEYNMI